MDLLLIYVSLANYIAGGTRGEQDAAATEHCTITISTIIGGVSLSPLEVIKCIEGRLT